MGHATRRVTAVFTVLAAALALALAACGGGTSTKDKNAYAEKVNVAQQKFALTVSTVSGETGAKNTIREQQRTLQRFEKAIDGVIKDLRGIDPPSEFTAQHQKLTDVMTGFGKAISQANDAMRTPTPVGLAKAKAELATATRSVNSRVAAAIAAINLKLRGK